MLVIGKRVHRNAQICGPYKPSEKKIYWYSKSFDQLWMLFFDHQPNRWFANEDEKEKEASNHVHSSNDS